MGVYGLWRLLDSAGKPVPLETLEGKVLAVDVSIWIYQILQGYQDKQGNPLPNAHLIGLFNRICKLLYYKIKPIFVFDGGVPLLKRDTIASRRKQKSIAASKVQQKKTDLINNLIKHSMVNNATSTEDKKEESGPSREIVKLVNNDKSSVYDMFKLPVLPGTSKSQFSTEPEDESDSEEETSLQKQSKWIGNIHSVNINSTEFKMLPADVRYDILTDLKETRKQNSWGRLHEMPNETHKFSNFQMERLLKRRHVQESLEEAEKEMGGRTLTLDELDKLLIEQGINTMSRDDTAFRIAADSTTRLIYISDKKGMIENRSSSDSSSTDVQSEMLVEPTSTESAIENIDEYLSENDSDFIVELEDSLMSPTRYFNETIMNPNTTNKVERSDLTQEQILALIEENKKEVRKTSGLNFASLKKNINNERGNENCIKISEIDISEETQTTCENVISQSTSRSDIKLLDNKSTSNLEPVVDVEVETSSINEDLVTSNQKLQADSLTAAPAMSKWNICEAETNVDSSDTDSDDFIEIHDVPIPDTDFVREVVKEKSLEINLNLQEKSQEDLFADVFADNRNNSISRLELFPIEQTVMQNNDDEGGIECLSNLENQNVNSNKSSDIVFKEICTESKEEVKSQTEEISSIDVETTNDKNPDMRMNIESDVSVTKCSQQADISNESVGIKTIVLPTNKAELVSMKAQLEIEQKELGKDIGQLERQATNITDQIRADAQELLRLFGIPYVVAPMEAEAQCAYLEMANLTNGTITDDSDIWLFGGQCVYKHFFNNNKRVLQFQSCDIQHHFKLTRRQMIQFALLVGSDYTMGVAGIGPVTALEILAAFPADGDNLLQGLTNFRSWIKAGKAVAPGKTTLRNKLRHVQIQTGFPNKAVAQAYLTPTVDESKEGFTWSKPNLILLADYARQKFGWSKMKFDKILEPIMKRQEEKGQRGLEAYFKVKKISRSIEPNLSKRVQKAIQQLGCEELEEPSEDREDSVKRNKSVKRKVNKVKSKLKEANPNVDIADTGNDDDNSNKNVPEYIPQREKDKANALKKKLRAIEVFRKFKKGSGRTKKLKPSVRKVTEEAQLSESSSSSN